ncbi:MAG: methyltransferase domain-containing protein [Candidatus Dormibacteraeota bacterium]|nr:methyltransferase domain-containing protein [Candidatus Dormibacteraeota bacterium]
MTTEFSGAAGQFGAAYNRRAPDYAAAIEPTFRPAYRRIVELAGITPGMEVLDLATGTGGVAREAASAGGLVTGIDVSERMLEIATRTSPNEITFALADAGKIPFGDASFDRVTCGFGLSHMPQVGNVLSEVRRVLKRTGSLVASCWGQARSNLSRDAVQSVLEQYLPGWSDPFSQIMNEERWAEPENGLGLLRSAGFDSVGVVTERLGGVFATPVEALGRAVAGPTRGEMVDAIQPAAGAKFQADALAAIEAAGDLSWWEIVNYYVAS